MQSPKSPAKLVRFQQRLSNLNYAFEFLQATLWSSSDVRVKNAAIIKAFEMSFELCGKTLKDFLEYNGILVSSPRDTIKEAFKAGYLTDGQAWIDLLDRRNQLVHVYNEEQSIRAVQEIHAFAFKHLDKLVQVLNQLDIDSK